MELNQQQQRAVETADGPVLIIAGPGTGKTKTLTSRIAYLLQERHIQPQQVVALTFTHKAADEMRRRLANLVGSDAALLTIATFHALSLQLLQARRMERKLLDTTQRDELLRQVVESAGLKSPTTRELRLLLTQAKSTSLAPADPKIAALVEQYDQLLAANGLYDFDDLLRLAYDALVHEAKPAYRYVLVDEFQDTNELQYDMLKFLTAGDNIFAIGDPNQSIYSFRGAGGDMFTRFQTDFPVVQTIELTKNYRSRPEIVQLANAVFPDSVQLRAMTAEAGTVRVIETLNEYSEAAYILAAIEQGIGGSNMLTASGHRLVAQPRDYAVLYRTHRAASVLQKLFADSGIPFQIAGEGSPYETPQVQAVIVALKHMHELAIPLDNLLVRDLAVSITEQLGYAIDDSLRQLFNSLVQFGSCRRGLAGCLKYLDEMADREYYDPSANAVTLLTIHAAKGLEFEYVFLAAAEEGVLPKLSASAELAEEQRLFYVAVTRAKQSLTLLYAKTRGGKAARPSRFIASLSRHADPSLASLERKARRRSLKRAQGRLF